MRVDFDTSTSAGAFTLVLQEFRVNHSKTAAVHRVLAYYGLQKTAKYAKPGPPSTRLQRRLASALAGSAILGTAGGALGAGLGGIAGGLHGAMSDDPDASALREALSGAGRGALAGGALGVGLGGIAGLELESGRGGVR